MKEDSSYHIVHPNEVDEFFERIGLLGELRSGKIICDVCKSVITKENFKSATRQGRMIFSCDLPVCFDAFLTLTSGEASELRDNQEHP